MKRKTSIISDVITLALTVLGAFFAIFYANKNYVKTSSEILGAFLLGAIISGFISTLVHETGHLISAKKNGFKVTTFTVWFFRWTLLNGKYVFSFTFLGEEAGSTETVPMNTEKLEKRFYRLTRGGITASLVTLIVGIPSLFLTEFVPFIVYSVWVMFVPVGAYFFFGSVLPAVSGGMYNDGAVLLGLKKRDDVTRVILSLQCVHACLYQGKTPCEIDKKYFLDVPQLPEDSPYFLMLLNARFNYFIDSEKFEDAKKCMDRLLSLEDYMPKSFRNAVYADALYSYCTFDFNENKADDFSYEIEKYLNKVNSVTNLRVKLAYILYVKGETEYIEDFYKKGVSDSAKCQIKGIGAFEKKLLDKMKADFPTKP